MELRQLSYFVAVAEELSFTRAAERVMVAQPAISQQIRRLEHEVGEPLFDRLKRGVRLTDAGQALLPHARAALASAEQGRDAVAALSGLLAGRLVLGTVQHPPAGLAELLGRFRQAHPGVEIKVREGHSDTLLSAVAEGRLDAAFVGLGPHQRVPSGLRSAVVASEPVVVAVRPDHPLAQEASVPLTRLRDLEIATLPEGSGLRTTVESATQAAGFTPRVIIECSKLGLLVDLAANGVSLALLPQSAIESAADLAVVHVRDPSLHHRLVLAWRESGQSAAGRAFLTAARDHFTAPSADETGPQAGSGPPR
ncbi:LysR family transcriptional regulator [Streptomyces caeni]|uniref:LysR family transcriptional regulator n=1 Tax=Streptomyces caeni TaxID=2307231 RepID=A0ABW4IZK5_9ACTN